ncbi:MAG: hypothetical protein KC877_01650 [Candidatus Kaiserbacteria bacterium]|nr:hypothetical protein [Candidatus Kaiserbacteria bacterium]MCB9816241.1 hypothetical protein [Candidatus Nomurabacteria bacterium]
MNILQKEIIASDSKVIYLLKFILLTVGIAFVLNLVWMMVFGMYWMIGVSEAYLALFLFCIVFISGLVSYILLKKQSSPN